MIPEGIGTGASAARSPRWSSARLVATVRGQPAPLALVVVLAVAAFLAPALYGTSNLGSVLRQASILGVVTVGQTVVLLGRGLDLSVGAVMGLSATVVTELTNRGANLAAAIAVALVVSAGVGVVNGWLVVRRAVSPFIATLGTYILVGGLRLAYTQGATSGAAPSGLHTVALGSILGLPTSPLLWLAVAGAAALALRKTVAGRWLYAAGGNPRTARLSGIPVAWVVFSTYVVASLLAGLGGLLQAGYTGYVDQYLGSQAQLDSITAALIGGASFAGGKGGVWGPATGALLLTVLVNLVVLLNLSNASESIVKGAVLLAAVALQGVRVFRRAGGGRSWRAALSHAGKG